MESDPKSMLLEVVLLIFDGSRRYTPRVAILRFIHVGR